MKAIFALIAFIVLVATAQVISLRRGLGLGLLGLGYGGYGGYGGFKGYGWGFGSGYKYGGFYG